MNAKKKNIYLLLLNVVWLFGYIFLLGMIYRNDTSVGILNWFVLYWLQMFVPVITMVKANETLHDYGFRKEKIGKQLLIGVITALVLWVIFVLIPYCFDFDLVEANRKFQHGWQLVLFGLGSLLRTGLTEEFVSRGFLYYRIFRLTHQETAAILGSSIIFGLLHFMNGNPFQICFAMLFGVCLCMCRKHIPHCTTLSLIVAHGIYDWLLYMFATFYL